VTPYRGTETWLLVGYLDNVPQYSPGPRGRVLPRKLATRHAAARGYRAVFRNEAPRARADTDGSLDMETVAGAVWWLAIFGIAFAGC
jgi:hypothetical protein